MKTTNKKAVEAILGGLEKFKTELETIQSEEESECIDQAIDDMEMLIEDLKGAREE